MSAMARMHLIVMGFLQMFIIEEAVIAWRKAH
jgi:hypothetical protein